MTKYIKKPIPIEAFKLGRDDAPEWFTNEDHWHGSKGVSIETLEGTMRAQNGDYIIKGIEGEIYPCKASIFEKSYNECCPVTSEDFVDGVDGVE